jgi:hypothetical protein
MAPRGSAKRRPRAHDRLLVENDWPNFARLLALAGARGRAQPSRRASLIARHPLTPDEAKRNATAGTLPPLPAAQYEAVLALNRTKEFFVRAPDD